MRELTKEIKDAIKVIVEAEMGFLPQAVKDARCKNLEKAYQNNEFEVQ